MNETNRQKKIASVLQEDLAQELQNLLRESGQGSTIVSVSKVQVAVDLSLAKVYISVFPADKASQLTKELNEIKPQIKHRIAQLTKHQLRRMPDLIFFNDDSLEYIEKINKAIKGDENPIKNPSFWGSEKNLKVNISFYIAKRYLFSKSSNNAINIITIIAAIGIIVGSFSLFIVLSGFAGLKDFSLQFTNVFDSDLKVYPVKGKTIAFEKDLKERLKTTEGIASFSEVIEERIFLQYKGKNHISYIKGVDEAYKNVTVVDSILLAGNWFEPEQHEVIIGLTTSAKLSLSLWDYSNFLEIYVPKPGSGQINIMDPSEAFSKKNVVVSGVYQVNEDLDAKYVFTDIDFARDLLSLDPEVISSIEIKLAPGASEKTVRASLEEIFGEDKVLLKNRIQQNGALYKMLQTENIAVYLIFTLVLIIALFNVIGSIIIMILGKRKNIKTLNNLGATLEEIRRIFFLQGMLMTLLAGVAGIIIGIIAVQLQLRYGFIHITETLPYPTKYELSNVIIVFLTIAVLGFIASYLASDRVRGKLLKS